MKGRNFTVSVQRAKYVTTDFVMVSVAFFLFNIFRFHELSAITVNFRDLWSFLTSQKLVLEQILIPVGLLGIYWLSGYYNRPFDKSRLVEFNTTLMSTLVATLLIFMILLINDTTGVKIRDYEIILVL